jgi:AhpD family alkylhydroperoxidase
MLKSNRTLKSLVMAAGLGMLFVAAPAEAEDASATAAYDDIQATLGSVPDMFKTLPDVAIAGAWAEIKSVQLNPNTSLDGKTKDLMGLAVASQIPCQYCVYFHTQAARLNGASDEEIKEAVAMAAIVRHWSISPPSRSRPTTCSRPSKPSRNENPCPAMSAGQLFRASAARSGRRAHGG